MTGGAPERPARVQEGMGSDGSPSAPALTLVLACILTSLRCRQGQRIAARPDVRPDLHGPGTGGKRPSSPALTCVCAFIGLPFRPLAYSCGRGVRVRGGGKAAERPLPGPWCFELGSRSARLGLAAEELRPRSSARRAAFPLRAHRLREVPCRFRNPRDLLGAPPRQGSGSDLALYLRAGS